MKKSTTYANLLSLTAFTLAMACCGHGTDTLWKLLIFQFIILWLSNEVWQRFTSIPGILGVLLGTLGKLTAEKTGKIGSILYRLSSLTLLIVPHLFYIILFVINYFTDDGINAWLGFELSHTLFVCSWCSILLLWLCAQITDIAPMSIAQAISSPLDWKALINKAYAARKNKREIAKHEDSVMLPPMAQALPPQHQDLLSHLLERDEQVLYTATPVLGVTNKHARRAVKMGYLQVAIILLLIYFSTGIAQQTSGNDSLLFLVVPVGLILLFSVTAYHFFREPSRWRTKLSNVCYAITNKRILIMEGEQAREFLFSEKLKFKAETINGTVGNIYITRTALAEALLGSMFAKLIDEDPQSAEEEPHLSRLLPGLFHVENVEEITLLIESQKTRTDNQKS